MKKITISKYPLKYDYFITESGEIFSSATNKFLSTRKDKDGYLKVRLVSTDGQRHTYSVHRLVLMNFNPVENMDTLQVNHIDGNKANNHVDNLEWCNYSQNMIHAHTTGLITPKYRECTINGITYKSISHAAKELGVSRKTIYNILKM